MESASVLVRAERDSDPDAIHAVHAKAFGRADEADLAGVLRREARPYIGLVADLGGQVAGHVVFSPVSIEGPGPPAMALGPLGVEPSLQRRGIGSKLVRDGLDACAAEGAGLVFVLGHPGYYPRFGFRPAAVSGFHYRSPAFDRAFFVKELLPGAVRGRSGWVRYHEAFEKV